MIIHKKEYPCMPRSGRSPKQYILPIDEGKIKCYDRNNKLVQIYTVMDENVLIVTPLNVITYNDNMIIDNRNCNVRISFQIGTIGTIEVKIIYAAPISRKRQHKSKGNTISTQDIIEFLDSE